MSTCNASVSGSTVTAASGTDSGTDLTSSACSIARFLVGTTPATPMAAWPPGPPTYQVSALDASAESALSESVSGTTKASWACITVTASNCAHVQAGRAHVSGGYALANGSNQNMGLNNLFYTSTLAQSAPGSYVIGNCP